MSYKELGLKCGIEIHSQLEGKKLFCNCPTLIRENNPDFKVRRKLRAVAGESGKIDVAALQEQIRDKSFVYEGYHDSNCLVELDEEPPHEINQDSFYTALQFSKLVKAKVPEVLQVMRKTVVDGSNTSGFQRTALIARDGILSTSEGKVKIENISLEEDSCKIIKETANEKTYRLDRLGIPLIEIGTAPDIHSPEQCQETAKKIGLLLRSLPGIKRGLGTIRQDVNISIKGGERIEIKGAQNLKQLPQLVELEMKRQAELIKLKKELKKVKLNPLKIVDLSKTLKNTKSKVLHNKDRILAIKINSFSNLLGRELQPNYRLGTELSGRAKIKAGVKGLFHSDELPNYGITEKEVEIIGKDLKCKKEDAFILIADDRDKARIALEAVYDRLKELWLGVPKEVRKANKDGTTSYLRPIPGAARMYPETDVPLLIPVKKIKLPELIEDKIVRFQKEYSLSSDLASYIAKSDKVNLFEELTKKHPKIKPAFVAETLTSTLVEIKRKYQQDPDKLTEENFRELFSYLNQDKIHKDIFLDVIIDMIKGNFDLKKYASLSTEEVHKVIKEVIDENPKAPFPALMGICMKKLGGKASGKFIAEELKKILNIGHK